MGLSVRQHATTAETGTGTQTCLFGSSVLSGSLLVVGFTTYPNTSSVTKISDNVNGTWSSGKTQALNGTQGLGGIYYFPNSASGTITVTVQVTGSFTAMCILEITGAATSSPVDVTAGSTAGASSSPATNSFTTLNANDILVAYAYQQASNTTYAAAGSYHLTDTNTGGGSGQGLAYLIVSTLQTGVTAGFTSAGAVDTGVVMVAFKAAAGTVYTQSFAAATAAFAATLAKLTSLSLTAATAAFAATLKKKTLVALAAATAAFAATITGARLITAQFNAATAAFAASLNKKTAISMSAATALFSAAVGKTTAMVAMAASLARFVASLMTQHLTFTPDYNQRLMLAIIAKVQAQGIHVSSSTLISTVCTFREGRGFNFPWVEAYDIGTVTADWLALEASGLVPPNIVTNN